MGAQVSRCRAPKRSEAAPVARGDPRLQLWAAAAARHEARYARSLPPGVLEIAATWQLRQVLSVIGELRGIVAVAITALCP